MSASDVKPDSDPTDLDLVFDNALIGIAVLRDRSFVRVNEHLCDMTGYRPAELLGQTTEMLYPHAAAYEEVGRFKYARMRAEGLVRFERPMRRRNGELFWCRLEGRALPGDDPLEGSVWIMSDITAERSRRERSLLHLGLFENSAQAILVTDAEARIISVNRAFTKITGYSEAEVLGQDPGLLRSGRHGRDFYQNMWASLADTGQWQGEIWNRRKDGREYPELLQIIAIRGNEDELLNYVGFFTDLSEAKNTEQRMHHMASHDSLTGLPRRSMLMEQLTTRLSVLAPGESLAVIAIDVNQFKRINESAGLEVGDELLVAFAERLAKFVPPADLAARLEGDDFVLIHRFRNPAQLTNLGSELRRRLSGEYVLHGVRYDLHVSIGVSVAPEDGTGPATLIGYAGLAQNRGRRPAQSTLEFFRRRMTEESVRRLEVERALRAALDEDQLLVYYQPQCLVDGGAIVGLEALVRWQHPQRGLVAPAEFVPVAEQIGLVTRMNRMVLEKACVQARGWLKSGVAFGRVSVNCGAEDFAHGDFGENVLRTLKRIGLAPECLTVEVTESTAIQDVGWSSRVLRTLRDRGVRIAMDDFGTGYSSLNALRSLPIDTLKLDRSFVSDLHESPESFALARAVMAMGSALGMTVLAEGVETKEQLRLLREMGCQRYQGYLRSRPVPADAIPGVISAP